MPQGPSAWQHLSQPWVMWSWQVGGAFPAAQRALGCPGSRVFGWSPLGQGRVPGPLVYTEALASISGLTPWTQVLNIGTENLKVASVPCSSEGLVVFIRTSLKVRPVDWFFLTLLHKYCFIPNGSLIPSDVVAPGLWHRE